MLRILSMFYALGLLNSCDRLKFSGVIKLYKKTAVYTAVKNIWVEYVGRELNAASIACAREDCSSFASIEP